jgi:hypothetical protein
MTDNEAGTETNGDGGMWLVRLPNGAVHAVTLEQLDDAYQRDLISGDVEVLEEDSNEWRKLSDLIGEEEPAPEAPPASQVPTRYPPAAYPPAAYASAVQAAAVYPHPGQAPAGYPSAVHSSAGQAVAGVAPVQNASASGARYGQPPVQPSQPSYAPAPLDAKSTAPVASDIYDLDLALGDSPFKRKSRRGVFVALGLAALGAVGVAVAVSQSSAEPAVASAPVQHSSAPVLAKALPPEPEIEHAKPAAETRLNDDTKRALAEADKHREKQKNDKKKAVKGQVRAGGSSHKRSSDVFSKGGDKHDPLNAGL